VEASVAPKLREREAKGSICFDVGPTQIFKKKGPRGPYFAAFTRRFLRGHHLEAKNSVPPTVYSDGCHMTCR
jgi:hypothetical protein